MTTKLVCIVYWLLLQDYVAASLVKSTNIVGDGVSIAVIISTKDVTTSVSSNSTLTTTSALSPTLSSSLSSATDSTTGSRVITTPSAASTGVVGAKSNSSEAVTEPGNTLWTTGSTAGRGISEVASQRDSRGIQNSTTEIFGNATSSVTSSTTRSSVAESTPTESSTAWEHGSQALGASRSEPGWTSRKSVHSIPPTAPTAAYPRITHYVEVGPLDQLFFQPSQVDADVGDIVEFLFWSLNHTLTQSSLQEPCTPSGKFDTGFRQFNPADTASKLLSFSVNDPNPQYFFCHQKIPVDHCHRGMVFAINPGGTIDNFLANVGSPQVDAAVPSTEQSSLVTNTETIAITTPTQILTRSIQPSTGGTSRLRLVPIQPVTLAALAFCVYIFM